MEHYQFYLKDSETQEEAIKTASHKVWIMIMGLLLPISFTIMPFFTTLAVHTYYIISYGSIVLWAIIAYILHPVIYSYFKTNHKTIINSIKIDSKNTPSGYYVLILFVVFIISAISMFFLMFFLKRIFPPVG